MNALLVSGGFFPLPSEALDIGWDFWNMLRFMLVLGSLLGSWPESLALLLRFKLAAVLGLGKEFFSRSDWQGQWRSCLIL